MRFRMTADPPAPPQLAESHLSRGRHRRSTIHRYRRHERVNAQSVRDNYLSLLAAIAPQQVTVYM